MSQRRRSLLSVVTPPLTPVSLGSNTIKVILDIRSVALPVLTSWIGLAGYGEQVKLVREPSNQYDR